MINKNRPLIAVVGPTASGKTELVIKIAEKLGGEIISADSMQIYKNISVASASPSVEDRKRVNHYLVEFLQEDSEYSVADFVKDAKDAYNEILSHGKLPVLVGGTGLYIDSFVNDLDFGNQFVDIEYRKKLSEEYDKIGGTEMLKKLSKYDKESAARLFPNDKKRIIRAFEIFNETGNTVENQNINSKKNSVPYEVTFIGINYENRENLYERINLRVEKMFNEGLVDEARRSFGSKNGGSKQAIGHKELYPYFSGEKTLEEVKEELKKQTRHYAKRQITWFNKNKNINWIYADKTPDVFGESLKILERDGYFEKQ